MKKNKDKYKKVNYILLAIVFIILILTTVFAIYPKFLNDTVGFVVTPFQKVFTSFAENTSEKIDNIKDKDSEQKKYEETLKLNEELLLEINRLKRLDDENRQLTELLNTVETYKKLPTTTAKVIGKDTSNWHNTLIIDKGAKDDLKVNMVVLSYGGLLGRVVEVSEFSSKIVTILDDSASISVANERTDELGLLKGDITLMASSLTKMEYYDSDADMLIGDEIITSNISSIYPPGISVGHITNFEKQNDSIVQKALVTPIVDFSNITTVLVVTELFTKSENVPNETISSLNEVTVDRNAGE